MRQRLGSVPLFAGLPDQDLERLCDHAEELKLSAGDELFAEGDAGDRAYVITSGEIEIVKRTGEREVLLAVRKPDEVIGEMALLQAAPRSATARARTDAELIAIPKSELDALMESSAGAVRALFDVLLQRWQATQAHLQQSERMAQLGTLTAGLAHELNNPAAAVGRAVGQLAAAVGDLAESERRLARGLDSEAERRIEALRSEIEFTPTDALDPVTRSDLEASVEDLLTDAGVPDAWRLASGLVEAGLSGAVDAVVDTAEDRAADLLSVLAAQHTVTSLLREVEEGTRRLSAIVGALKSYSYLDQAPVQDVDIAAGIDDTLLILKSKLAGITVRREYAPDIPRIEAFGSELNQVWTNLIDNATDAIRESGRKDGAIVIRVFHEGDNVVVEVEDNGSGIPEAVLARVFDSFFTTKPPGSGTGLGLNISYGIVVHKHRGDISVRSHDGRTVFRVEIPTQQESGR